MSTRFLYHFVSQMPWHKINNGIYCYRTVYPIKRYSLSSVKLTEYVLLYDFKIIEIDETFDAQIA